MKVPTNCAELYQAADLPYSEGGALISRADPSLVINCFTKLYPRFGNTFMHASDHHAALVKSPPIAKFRIVLTFTDQRTLMRPELNQEQEEIIDRLGGIRGPMSKRDTLSWFTCTE
jgi:hypothetical protein